MYLKQAGIDVLKAEETTDQGLAGLPVDMSDKVIQIFQHIDSFHNINLYQAENYIPTKKKNADQQIVRLPDDILAMVK